MKVLHLTNYFLPEYSGTATRLFNIAHRLPYDIQILTSNRLVKGNTISSNFDKYDNISVQRLPLSLGVPSHKNLPWQMLTAVIQDKIILKTTALRQDFELIHAHNSLVFGQAGLEISRKSNKPLILEYHGLAHDSSTGFFKSAKSFYIQQADKSVMRKADHVITLTKHLKEYICRHYGVKESKVTVVPNGADIERFAPKDEYQHKAAQLKNSLDIHGKVIMYAGIMDKINGIDILANVIPSMLAKKTDICFIFLGEPMENNKLRQLRDNYPGNVKLFPSVPYDTMPYYYGMCDIFVIPRPSTISAETIIPLKILEVMAMGKTVVASDVGGLAEVIKHGENGYLFHKGDNQDLENILYTALDADNTKISINARQTILDNYTWDKSVSTLSALYRQIAGKG